MIKIETRKYMASTMLAQSSVPSLSKAINIQSTNRAFIDDYEGLYIGYGKRDNCYPYPEQNAYAEETLQDVKVIVLENDVMYAEFLPTLGGRLWKLINKRTNKDVLYHNDVIRFRNLSVRNAWFSGGVEWNIGIIGHTPYTCSDLYAAKVTGKNGEEVLRFYEFERVREVYYQIDFWLDDDKLMTKVWICNPSERTVPMYWWSNIATPEFKGGRVIVPAHSAYNNSEGIGISKSPIPVDKGVDVSYPENIMDTIDYFYDISDASKKFIANVDSNGNGLLQYSSSRLKGRKLFSWGHRQGSRHWQDFLTDKAGDYVEIQAGLGKTQYECIPMPPKTTWSWVECYTNITLQNPVDSEYDRLVDEVSAKIDGEYMEALCASTLEDITKQKGEVIHKGNGYGYLNNLINKNCPSHLEFFPCAETQKWIDLARTGKLIEISQTDSFLSGETFSELLKKCEEQNTTNWLLSYQLALMAYEKNDMQKALSYVVQSILCDSNFQNNHLYMYLLKALGDEKYLFIAEKVLRMKSDDFSVAEDILKLLLNENQNQKVIEMYAILSSEVRENARIKMYLAVAQLNSGNAKEAETLLMQNGGLFVNDYREGDKMLNKLYKGIRVALYGEKYEGIIVPSNLDFVVVGGV